MKRICSFSAWMSFKVMKFDSLNDVFINLMLAKYFHSFKSMNGKVSIGDLYIKIVQKTGYAPFFFILASSLARARITASEARQCFNMFSFFTCCLSRASASSLFITTSGDMITEDIVLYRGGWKSRHPLEFFQHPVCCLPGKRRQILHGFLP